MRIYGRGSEAINEFEYIEKNMLIRDSPISHAKQIVCGTRLKTCAF